MSERSDAQTWCSAAGEVQGLPTLLRLTDDVLLVETAGTSQPRAVPLARVRGIRTQVGLRTGFVTVDLDGAESLVVSRVPKADARCFETALREVLRHPPAPLPEPAVALAPDADGETDPASPLAELERLARLRDAGAVTDEEFETAKRRLLGRL